MAKRKARRSSPEQLEKLVADMISVKCAFCGGNGVQPHTTDRLHCMACKGQGWVTAIEPSAECPDCNGTGLYLGTYRQHCPRCNGQGMVFQGFILTEAANE